MHRAVAAIALASFVTTAGCGQALIGTGATVAGIGLGAQAIPDQPADDGCHGEDGCIDLSFDGINEGKWMLTGAALMMAGVIVMQLQKDTEHKPAPAPPPIAPIATAEPAVDDHGAAGRWRPVPVVPGDDE